MVKCFLLLILLLFCFVMRLFFIYNIFNTIGNLVNVCSAIFKIVIWCTFFLGKNISVNRLRLSLLYLYWHCNLNISIWICMLKKEKNLYLQNIKNGYEYISKWPRWKLKSRVIPIFRLLSSIAQLLVMCAFFCPDLLLEVSKIKGCEFFLWI